MERSDLRVLDPCKMNEAPPAHKHTRPVTDADLASLGYVRTKLFDDLAREMGYVRLDGIDVEALRVTVESPSTPDVGPHGEPIQPYPVMRGRMIEGCRTTLRDGEYVLVPLAVIDQEDT